jgi:hypothetical protein
MEQERGGGRGRGRGQVHCNFIWAKVAQSLQKHLIVWRVAGAALVLRVCIPGLSLMASSS